MLQLMIYLTLQSRGASVQSRDALSNLHKDAQEGAFVVALKAVFAFEVALELHLWLHLC